MKKELKYTVTTCDSCEKTDESMFETRMEQLFSKDLCTPCLIKFIHHLTSKRLLTEEIVLEGLETFSVMKNKPGITLL